MVWLQSNTGSARGGRVPEARQRFLTVRFVHPLNSPPRTQDGFKIDDWDPTDPSAACCQGATANLKTCEPAQMMFGDAFRRVRSLAHQRSQRPFTCLGLI